VPSVCRALARRCIYGTKSRSDRATRSAHLVGARIQRSRSQNQEAKVLEPNHPRRTGGRSGSSQQTARRARSRQKNFELLKQTLSQYLDRWLEVSAKPRLRAKSLHDYEVLLRRYVRPGIGAKALAVVSAFDIQTLYRELVDQSLSARSIRYTLAVLRSSLKQAVRWNLILANPADSVDLPRQDRRRVCVLAVENLHAGD
jgi:hypothetical protein